MTILWVHFCKTLQMSLSPIKILGFFSLEANITYLPKQNPFKRLRLAKAVKG